MLTHQFVFISLSQLEKNSVICLSGCGLWLEVSRGLDCVADEIGRSSGRVVNGGSWRGDRVAGWSGDVGTWKEKTLCQLQAQN